MKSLHEVKAFYQNAKVGTKPTPDRAVLIDALQAGGLIYRERPRGGEWAIWRFLVESRMTKLTVAAIFIMASVLAVHYLNGTAVEAVELSEITKAMERVPWLRMTSSGSEQPGTEAERWFGFESKVHAVKWIDGDIDFESVTDRKSFTYSPSSNTITVRYMEDVSLDFDLTSPTQWLDSLHEMLERQGARTAVVRMGDYQGHRVQIQEMSYSTRGERRNLTLYIDPDTKQLYAGRVVSVDGTDSVAMDAHLDFDYPSAGPRSIYDLGVPTDARVVDETPSADFMPVWEEYLRHKAEIPDEYVAVIVHQTELSSNIVQMLDVNYRSGRKLRLERYYPHRDVFAELGPHSRKQPGNSIEPWLAWAHSRYDDPNVSLRIQLDDGQSHVTVFRNVASGWGKLDKAKGRAPGGLEEAWPIIAPTSHLVEDDDARANGLICVETLTQGKVVPGFGVSNPGRFRYCLDPAHDYLCRRQVMEWRPDAEWQQDKDWLNDVDPSEMRDAAMLVCEIVEVFQAGNGRWYPRGIVEKEKYGDLNDDDGNVPMKVTDVKTIYLDISPTFPNGIFDIDRLPGQ